MKKENIELVRLECLELLKRIEDFEYAKSILNKDYLTCKESSALKRQSMELTRALTKMREP
jgi:hypothetical protein